jgi:hypothetical protein
VAGLPHVGFGHGESVRSEDRAVLAAGGQGVAELEGTKVLNAIVVVVVVVVAVSVRWRAPAKTATVAQRSR